jgi:hypothetical protein
VVAPARTLDTRLTHASRRAAAGPLLPLGTCQPDHIRPYAPLLPGLRRVVLPAPRAPAPSQSCLERIGVAYERVASERSHYTTAWTLILIMTLTRLI